MKMENEAFYKICFDALIDGLCVADEQGRIVMNNSACEEIFGYDSGELIGKTMEAFDATDYETVQEVLRVDRDARKTARSMI